MWDITEHIRKRTKICYIVSIFTSIRRQFLPICSVAPEDGAFRILLRRFVYEKPHGIKQKISVYIKNRFIKKSMI